MKAVTSGIVRRGVLMTAFVATAFTLGCANPQRPDPGEAFNALAEKSMAEDVAFVRARLSPDLIDTARQAGVDVESDAFVREVMAELQVCKAQGWEKTDLPQRVRIDAAGIKPGRVQRQHYDMIYDKACGWMLATRAYGEKPLGSPPADEK